jgi:hypothetical protein
MKRFLVKTGLFILVVALFITGVLLIQDTKFIVGRKKVYLEQSADKEYDLMVLGSSRALHSFNPNLYTGNKKLFNMGEEGHGLPSNYLMLKILEKHGIRIHKLLLEVDEYTFQGSKGFSRQFRDDFFVTDIDDPEVYEAFKKYRGTAFANTLRYFPKSANLIYCDLDRFVKHQLLSMKKIFPGPYKVYQRHLDEVGAQRGFMGGPPSHSNIPIKEQHYRIEADDQVYFEKLIGYCQAHHIEVYFYRTPILRYQKVRSEEFDHYIDSFSKANNIPFFDYKSQYQWPDMYVDQNHPTAQITVELTKDILFKLGFR